ncbi:MAG TPA: hypothetical protein VHM26_03855, partial [Chitinophagaceae bacterium]|nr:hypothetical protein [Chitinophagaceae bacterium]
MEKKYRFLITCALSFEEFKLDLHLMPFIRYVFSSGNVVSVKVNEIETNVPGDSDAQVRNNPESIFICLERLVADKMEVIDMDLEIFTVESAYRITVIEGWEVDILSSDEM